MTDMTRDELQRLVDQIILVINGEPIENVLAALGIVVVRCLGQYDSDSLPGAAASWVTSLTHAVMLEYKRRSLH